jgi:hypothetical protein
MSNVHHTLPPILVPDDRTEAEVIQAGRHMAELLEHPGYAELQRATRGWSLMIGNRVSTGMPSDNAAYYADAVGEQRGLKAIERIAQGVIDNGKLAERASTETGGS